MNMREREREREKRVRRVASISDFHSAVLTLESSVFPGE
jgi:hypothetical protein